MVKKKEKAISKKYLRKLNKQLEEFSPEFSPEMITPPEVNTADYEAFKKEIYPAHMSIYEKVCNFSEKILKITPKPEKKKKIQGWIDTCHLNVSSEGVISFSIVGPIIFILLTATIFLVLKSFFFMVLSLITGLILINVLGSYPKLMATRWRMRASNQMVLSVFYVVTFMRHTPNMELATKFAADHLAPPLSLDFKKVLWNLETGQFDSIIDSLEDYLSKWKEYNLEFIESFHLIESSLFEGSEERRMAMLEKSLDVILSETYEKMLHYTHEIQSPITTLHMLGVVLPILSLVILPLVVSFMGEVKWYYIAAIYNFFFPVVVFYYGRAILSMRPSGYGDADISKKLFKKKKMISVLGTKISPLMISLLIAGVFLLIGILPLILHTLGAEDFGFGGTDPGSPCERVFCFLGYMTIEEEGGGTQEREVGPYGLISTILSVFVVMAAGISTGLYYTTKTKKLMKIRQKTKKLELEFSSGLFQLANRLSDGLPAEIAFGKVAETLKGTDMGGFFSIVNHNVENIGMSVERSIFDDKVGAINFYPSSIIESSMKVLVQSVEKGPKIAAQAMMSVARYIKELHQVDERLKDLMAETTSSIKSQITFLAPSISGVVIGITSMISLILQKLSGQLAKLGGEASSSPMANLSGVLGADFFGVGLPTYYFQIVVGLYVVEIVFILSIIKNNIEEGEDKLSEKNSLGKNLLHSTVLYVIVAVVVMVLFNFIAGTIVANTLSGMG